MQIIDFTKDHIEQAIRISKKNYDVEREYISALPPADIWPDMQPFAENGLGVAAFEGEELIGFLCCVSPFGNAFRSTDAIGVFSPMHGNGAIAQNKGEIYARMYQAAAQKWAKAKATSHSICLYAHDTIAQQQFYRYGFGLRCIDAIRPMEEIISRECSGYNFRELSRDEFILVYPLYDMLGEHMASSPTFIARDHSQEAFYKSIASETRYFVAEKDNEIVAFLKIDSSGETFITEYPALQYIGDALCLPKHRGIGLYPNLLNFTICTLKDEGFKYLGVDFESINPTAYHFWPKYFSVYTYGVVRRIDEKSINLF